MQLNCLLFIYSQLQSQIYDVMYVGVEYWYRRDTKTCAQKY